MKRQLIQVNYSKNKGRGVFATTDIKNGELILEVDESKFITYSMFAEHPLLGKLINQTEHKKVEFAYFMAYATHQKEIVEENEDVYKYLNSLPAYYQNLICWNDQELDSLGNEALAVKIKNRKDTIKEVYQQISEIMLKMIEEERAIEGNQIGGNNQSRRGSRRFICCLPAKKQREKLRTAQLSIIKKITLEEVINFIAMVESRNAYYPNVYDTNSEVGALVMELQMFNHSHQSKCRVDLNSQCYRVIAEADINKGEQIFVDYGPFSREEFLEFYGMLPGQDKENQCQTSGEQGNMETERKELIAKYRRITLGQDSVEKGGSYLEAERQMVTQANY